MKPEPQNIVSPIPPALDALRRNIDWIDDQILDLLEQRYSVVKRIAWAKTRDAEPALAVRPEREAAIIDRLAARAIHVPEGDVAKIWRSILALSAHHQRAYRVILSGPPSARLALGTLAAARYGEGVKVDWAEDEATAVGAALRGEAILIVAADRLASAGTLGLDLIGQHATGCVEHPWALELGRIGTEERKRQGWSPASWRGKVHRQLPAYADHGLARSVEAELAASEPVVALEEVGALRALVADAQQGRRMLVQAGDCAEPIGATRDDVLAMAALIDALGRELEQRTGLAAIRVGRIGGQFAKPRSEMAEGLGTGRLPAYRGDAVNGHGSCPVERMPDPRRLRLAHAQARRVAGWLAGKPLHTSHEALLLNHESALTRSANGVAWAGSAHSLWLGERTRELDGAHVEYLRGIANPIGIKCGPAMTPAELRALLERLDPERTPGRIMLIARLGHGLVEDRLPGLMAAVRASGHDVLWVSDPMHGNNRSANGTKVRLVPEVIAEAEGFARVARSMGVHPGGLHLEVTPRPVLECVERIEEAVAGRPYESLCDPRLNAGQAARVVAAFADAVGGRS